MLRTEHGKTIFCQVAESVATTHAKRAPGPKGTPLAGNMWSFWHDVFKMLLEGPGRYGDVVRFRVLRDVYHLIAHPDDIHQVLVKDQKMFSRSAARSSQILEAVTGKALLTLEGEEWQKHRRLCNPALGKRALETGIESILASCESFPRKLREDGEFDVQSVMTSLTANIAGRTFFGSHGDWEEKKLEESIDAILSHHWRRIKSRSDLVHKLPGRSRRRFDRAMDYIGDVVDQIMSNENDEKSLLGRLQTARSEGNKLSDEDIHNEIVTFLLAGHETTATALLWAFYLLAKYPQWQEKISAEMTPLLQPEPDLESLRDAVQTRHFICETLRLYPSVWLIERVALKDYELRGFEIPKGSTVIVSSLVTHRHPDFWDEPNHFYPERFGGEYPEGAYFPFSMGAHACIGRSFALLEMQLILGELLRQYRFEWAGEPFEPHFAVGITLRMKERLALKAVSTQ